MRAYPVHYSVVPCGTFSRLQLLARLVAFLALGALGLSFGAIFCFAYLALPAYAASRLASTPERYVPDDGPRVIMLLRWFAAICAWTGLVSDRLPARAPSETIRLEVAPTAQPTAGAVLARVITGLPSAMVLGFLGWIGVFVWLWGALTILFVGRVGDGALRYLTGVQRWSARLLVYQAGLVDAYPPFSFADPPASLADTAVLAASGRP